jgi:glutamyl endopeptidase
MRQFKIAVLALAVLSAPAVWGQAEGENAAERSSRINPHTPVSSDGSAVAVERWSDFMSGVDGVEGTASEGFADDSQAEFSGREETAEEVWALLEHRPLPSPLGQETVIGADTRVRVNPTTVSPYKRIGLVTFTQPGGSFICTAWLIGKDTVATAGHCVFGNGAIAGGARVWSTNVRFYAGRNGALSPYGVCSARRLYSVVGWTGGGGDERYDYGAIKLNCNVGNTVGTFGFWWQAASLTGLVETISGYPGDKPFGQQWRSSNFPIVATETRQVFYKNDTFGGMSGSPVFQPNRVGSFCQGLCAMAIHAYGLHNGGNHAPNNHGTRIVQAVFNNLIAWRNAL